ncbi:MAG TPA: hypothetical protein VG944_22350 [Fimbriimonas sp.]|nr:hypothetical protein [Fimbriimonas sp.]
MSLNEFVAQLRKQTLRNLEAGLPPDEGAFDEEAFRKAKDRGKPQMGPFRFEPARILLDFLYLKGGESALVLTVAFESPERIVYMPVPEWVVEQVWQGDVQGSYHFDSEARELLRRFESRLEPATNAENFGPPESFRRV